MSLTQAMSWIGVALGMSIGIPQIVKTIRMKSARDISAITYMLIVATCTCMLIRAVAIQELAFICYYTFLIAINALQLFLIWKYRKQESLLHSRDTGATR